MERTVKLGTKEARLRELREKNAIPPHVDTLLRDGLPLACVVLPGEPNRRKTTTDAKPQNGGVTLAPPLSIQKALAREFAEDEPTAPAEAEAQPKESTVSKTNLKTRENRTVKKTATKTATKRPNANARTKVKADAKPKQPKGMVVEILKLSSRENGVSPAQLNELTKWKGAPWKWLFSNPKKTGYCDRWGYTFKVVDFNGETRYKTEKKS